MSFMDYVSKRKLELSNELSKCAEGSAKFLEVTAHLNVFNELEVAIESKEITL